MTGPELLAYRRLVAGYDGSTPDHAIEIEEGYNVDGRLAAQLRAWYLQLLDTAPVELLAPDNIAAMTTVTSGQVESLAEVPPTVLRLPAICRRVFAVQLRGWHHAVAVQPSDRYDEIFACQQNPFTAATVERPVAVALPSATAGQTPAIAVWPAGVLSQVSLVTAVTDQGDDIYAFDERALEQVANLPMI